MQIENKSLVVWAAIATLMAGCAGGGAAASPAVATLPGEVPLALTVGPEELPGPAASIPTPETITTEQLNQRLDPFADPACALPCYNGLIPAQADFAAALGFYSRLGISPADMTPGSYDTTLDGTGHLAASLLRASDVQQAVAEGYRPPRVDIAMQGGVANNIVVNWPGQPPYLSVPKILAQMGPPEEVKVALIFTTETPNFLVQLSYGSRQSGFVFRGEAVNTGPAMRVCLDAVSVTGSALGVYSPGSDPFGGVEFEQSLLPLEESTGISVEQFTVMATSGACLDIAADRWAAWQTVGP